jgi:maltose alpha-D-glucosyltransferase/alpha-amylase
LEVEKSGARTTGVIYDAFGEEAFSRLLLEMISSRRRFRGQRGTLIGRPTQAFRRIKNHLAEPLKITVSKIEQNNSTMFYNDQLIVKLFRRLEEGVNPELEIETFLTDKAAFPHAPPLVGAIEYHVPQRQPVTIGVMEGFVHNAGNAWNYTVEMVDRYCENLFTTHPLPDLPADLIAKEPLLKMTQMPVPKLADEMIGPYLESVALLGRRTAELHIALASDSESPHFGQEPFSQLYQRSLYQAMRNLASRSFQTLRRGFGTIPEELKTDVEAVIAREGEAFNWLHRIVERKINAMRIRCHGDYHLGQVLYTGNDFVIIDFEGEPARSITERQLKACPLRDVAGMIRSFDYACYSAVADQVSGMVLGFEDTSRLHAWMQFWSRWSSASFLKSYLATTAGQTFMPSSIENVQLLLDVYLLEKALYELTYELSNRPSWARIPLHGILELLETGGT